jgi:uncharacterized phiE125 gp8 family phage protein
MNEFRCKVASAPASEPVSLDEFKLILKLDDTEQDSYLTNLLKSSRELIEKYLSRALITQTIELSFDSFVKDLYLWRAPIQSITSVIVYDSENSSSTITNTNYFLLNDELIFNDDFSLDISLRTRQGIKITYIAGYGAASSVPASIKNAILNYASFLYDCKCETVQLPLSICNALSSYQYTGYRLNL